VAAWAFLASTSIPDLPETHFCTRLVGLFQATAASKRQIIFMQAPVFATGLILLYVDLKKGLQQPSVILNMRGRSVRFS
jgi:hypothetical protein